MRSILTQFAPFSEPKPRDPGQLRKAHKIAQWRTNLRARSHAPAPAAFPHCPGRRATSQHGEPLSSGKARERPTQFAPFSEPNPRDPGQLRKAHKIAQWRTNSSLYDQADTEPISSARDGRPLVFSASESSADPRNWRRDRVLRPRPTFPYLRGAPQRNARRCPRNLIFQNPESSAWQPSN